MFDKYRERKLGNSLNKDTGLFIRQARLAKSLTGQELGKLIHVSQQQISRYEKGDTVLNIETLYLIFSVLNVNWKQYYLEVLYVNSINDDEI